MSDKSLDAQLRSPSAKQRFLAIRQIAKNKDVTKLTVLQEIAHNDDDEQVREVARRAADYIKGEARAQTRSERVKAVSERDVVSAKRHIDAAVNYQINDQRDRALEELAKARAINPGLDDDAFYRNVLEEVSGMDVDEALKTVGDQSRIKEVVVGEREKKREQRARMHRSEVDRSNWTSVMMDLLIYGLILTFATMFLPVVMAQAAQSYVTNTQAALAEYEDDLAAGDLRAQPPVRLDPEFEASLDQYQLTSMGLTQGVISGVSAGIGGVVGILIQLGATHVVARYLFGGQATFPYLIYKVVSFYNARLPILYGLIYLGIVLTFLMAGGFISIIFLFAIGIFNLFIAIKVISRIGETYDFGALKGCLSFIIASFVLGLLAMIPILIFYGSLAAYVESTRLG